MSTTTKQHATIPAEAARRPRLRLINPNSPLSNITMPGLIRSMTFTRKAIFAPTGLMICAEVVPRTWDVEIVDECTLETPHAPRADVDLVGISVMTTQAPRAYALADAYRALGVAVVLGGIHPSALPQEALEHCDAVCKGDAESTIPHLIADWEAARDRGDEPRSGLKSIYDWAEYPSAEIATPRKDLLDPREYLIANPIQTTRGCPHGCHFCTTPAVFGRKFRQRSVASIVEEIREAQERHKAWSYIFADDNFGGKHSWAIELCEALRPLKITWATQCDCLIAKNERLLQAMKDSGCVGLILGLESPKRDTLVEAGKQFITPESYEWRIRKIQSYGINLWGAFIFGFDHDTWRDCRDAVHFAQRMNLAMSCYPILTPYPGTVFFEQFQREGRIRTYDWQRYNGASVVFEPKQMTAKELRMAQMAAFAEFFSLGSAFRRLHLFPLKWRSWIANLAIGKGISYYYARRGRQVPAFRDFMNRRSRAWNFADEIWDPELTPPDVLPEDPEDPTDQPGCTACAPIQTVIAQATAATDPLTQAALHLGQNPLNPNS